MKSVGKTVVIPKNANGLVQVLDAEQILIVSIFMLLLRVMMCYKCEGCLSLFEKKEIVIKHVINGNVCYFCLNYYDWIQLKANVFNDG